MSKININGYDITIINQNDQEYICLSEMVGGHEDGTKLIERWMNTKNTVDFLGVWEQFYNPEFLPHEFKAIREEVGSSSFFLSTKKWIERTKATGITAKTGRYGGTFAHVDIALEFGSYISPEFKLLMITEFKRLKEAESINGKWDVRRYISKVNYKLQTDAIKSVLIPLKNLPKAKEGIVYAEEADLLYYAMFGYTSKEWRLSNPDLALQNLNIRDVANTHQLIILANLESLNSTLIRNGMTVEDRLITLRKEAISQLTSLKSSTELNHELIESSKSGNNVVKSGADNKYSKAIASAKKK